MKFSASAVLAAAAMYVGQTVAGSDCTFDVPEGRVLDLVQCSKANGGGENCPGADANIALIKGGFSITSKSSPIVVDFACGGDGAFQPRMYCPTNGFVEFNFNCNKRLQFLVYRFKPGPLN
ncbi:hypothetical protein E4U53_000185 [Claviceps sorghi]|nr:hypothetical protein E4U53_000185 [Claviceps sorghi]